MLFTCLCFSKIVNAQGTDPNMGIIPAPVSVKKMPGEFMLSQETVLLADSLSTRPVIFFCRLPAKQSNAAYHTQS